ncbi:MAG: hypothetical protein R2879_17045 [Saprospiraceae bacterium]
MEHIFQFDFSRFGSLVLRDLKQYWKTYALFAGLYAGIILATSLIYAYDNDNDLSTVHLNFFPFGLLMGGFFFTSIIFRELGTPVERSFYLALPASNLEKVVSKLLITSVIFTLVTLMYYTVFSYINNGIVYLLTDLKINNFEPFSSTNWMVIKVYLITQSIFLLGAVSFPKYSLPMTLLAFLIILFIVAAVLFLVFRITFADHFPDSGPFSEMEGMRGPVMIEGKIEAFGDLIETLFNILFAPALWIVTYFKLSEKEA